MTLLLLLCSEPDYPPGCLVLVVWCLVMLCLLAVTLVHCVLCVWLLSASLSGDVQVPVWLVVTCPVDVCLSGQSLTAHSLTVVWSCSCYVYSFFSFIYLKQKKVIKNRCYAIYFDITAGHLTHRNPCLIRFSSRLHLCLISASSRYVIKHGPDSNPGLVIKCGPGLVTKRRPVFRNHLA